MNIQERIARALWEFHHPGEPWDDDYSGHERDAADAVIEALGIQPRAWVKHDGERVPYYVITWRPE